MASTNTAGSIDTAMATATETTTETQGLDSAITVLSQGHTAGVSHNGGCSPSSRSSARILEPLDVAEPPNDDDTTAAAATTEKQYPTGTKFWLTILSLCVVLIIGGLDNNIVATAAPSITNHFHTVADVGWYASAFRICTCAFQFMFGKMYKLFSIKSVFLATNVIFLIGSVLCATAASSPMFVVGRAVSGLGFAGEMAGCFAVIVEILPLRRRPVFAGLLACVESLAIIAAPVVGGALTQSMGWRWCFWINLPMGGVSLAAFTFLFSNPRVHGEGDGMTLKQKIKELDLVSNCLFIPALTVLFVALSWAGTKYPWSDGKVIGLFVVFAVLFGAFIFNQRRRGDSAALPFRVLKSRSVVSGALFTLCTNSMMQVLEYYLPIYYQVVRENTPHESGLKMIPIMVGMMLGLFLQGIGTTALGYYAPFMIFASVCMPVAAGLMTTYNLDTNLTQIILYSGFAGFAGGIGFQGPQSAVQTTLPAADVNLGIGVILFAQNFGPALCIAIAQVIFTNQLSRNLEGVVDGLTPSSVEKNSLSDLKNGVPVERWSEVFAGIDESLIQTWYLAIALGCATMVASLCIEWRSVKHKQT